MQATNREKAVIVLTIVMLIAGIIINEYATDNVQSTTQSQRLHTEAE